MFKRGVGLLEVAGFFFFFLGSSANKDAGIAQTTVCQHFLAFWQRQMKKDLMEKEEGEYIKEG